MPLMRMGASLISLLASWGPGAQATIDAGRRVSRDDEFLAHEILAYGAYFCVRPNGAAELERIASLPVPGLVERLGLHGEFEAGERSAASGSIAFLQRRK